MPENSKKIKPETPVITSPDGVKIKITEGRKLQQIREYARDPLITDAQFRVLVVMVDRTNEGYGSDETKWGYSYANYKTLGDDTAKTPSAVKRIVKELETGERKVGTGKKKEIKSCNVALSVERDSRPGRSKVNHYWQPSLNRIAAVEETKKGPVSDDKGSGLSKERVRFSGQKGPAARPDSTQYSPQRPNSYNSKNACGVGPADSQVRRKEATNDNEESGNDSRSISPWSDDYRERFWNLYPRKPGDSQKKAIQKLEEIQKSDSVEFSDLMKGLGYYAARINQRVKKDPDDRKFITAAQNWLDQARWETEEPEDVRDKHASIRARMKVAI